MGYTWEADLQMFMKRAWALDAAWAIARSTRRACSHILGNGTKLGRRTFN